MRISSWQPARTIWAALMIRSDAALTLRTVRRLAAALGLLITSIFRQPEDDADPGDSTPDGRRLEALLCDTRNDRLASRGTMISSSGRKYRLTARGDILTSEERQRLERAHHTRLGLQVPKRCCKMCAAGPCGVGWTRTMSDKERVPAGSQFKAGLVEVAGDRIALAEDAKFSLETTPSLRTTTP